MKTRIVVYVLAMLMVGCIPNGNTQTALPVVIMAAQTYEPSPTPVIITPTPQATIESKPVFGPATEWPRNLDEAWAFIEEGRPGWVFPPCREGQLTKPFITWQMAELAVFALPEYRRHPFLIIGSLDVNDIIASGGGLFSATGTINVEENQVFGKLAELVLMGKIKTCSSSGDGKPSLYGPGIQDFLDWLGGYSTP